MCVSLMSSSRWCRSFHEPQITVSCSSEQSPHSAARSLNGTLLSGQTTISRNSRNVRHIKYFGSLATCLMTFPSKALCARRWWRRVLSLLSKKASMKYTNICRVGRLNGSIQVHSFRSLLLAAFEWERSGERGIASLFSEDVEKSKLRYNSNAKEWFRDAMEVRSARAQFCLTLTPLERWLNTARIRCCIILRARPSSWRCTKLSASIEFSGENRNMSASRHISGTHTFSALLRWCESQTAKRSEKPGENWR